MIEVALSAIVQAKPARDNDVELKRDSTSQQVDAVRFTTHTTREVLMTIKFESVSLEDAQRVIAAGQSEASKIGSPSNVAVVDAGGNLVSHIRMDNAWVGSVDISINKAFTARAFDIATNDLAEQAQPGEQFYGIQGSNHGRVMVFAGGIPLRRDGLVVGAVGVSGGSGLQDQMVAEAAAAAF